MMNRDIFLKVKKNVLENWDPIGISLMPEPLKSGGESEYDNYIPKIITILENDNEPLVALIKCFSEVRSHLGLNANNEHDLVCAKKMIEMYKREILQKE